VNHQQWIQIPNGKQSNGTTGSGEATLEKGKALIEGNKKKTRKGRATKIVFELKVSPSIRWLCWWLKNDFGGKTKKGHENTGLDLRVSYSNYADLPTEPHPSIPPFRSL
jgi:hypothetical protein